MKDFYGQLSGALELGYLWFSPLKLSKKPKIEKGDFHINPEISSVQTSKLEASVFSFAIGPFPEDGPN